MNVAMDTPGAPGCRIGHFRVVFCLSFKTSLYFVQDHSNKNDFDLHENGRAGETHFHMNGSARRLVLRQRHSVTWKCLFWPNRVYNSCYYQTQKTVNT